MAEAAGLALGAVALVGLFQTAVEFLEYFEDARNLQADRELATTKISLLEVRLKQWGRDLHIHEVGQEWDAWLRMHCLEEGGLIAKCLIGISSILGDASELTNKYGLDKTKRRNWSSVLFHVTRFLYELRRRAPKTKTSPAIESFQKPTSLGSKVTWAVRDKKRFQSLLSELDFLITNLERVSGHLLQQDTPASRLSSESSRTLSTQTHQDIDMEKIDLKALHMESRERRGVNQGSSTMTMVEDPVKAPSTSSKNAENAANTSSGNEYDNCSSTDDAVQNNGDLDATQGRQHKYKDQKAGGSSTQLNGNGTGKSVAEIVRAQREARAQNTKPKTKEDQSEEDQPGN